MRRMSDLRADIEQIIYDALDYDDEDVTLSRHLAAVLIRELGLRQEWGCLDDDDSGVLADTREELRLWPGDIVKHRYITEWKADDE